MRVFMTGAGGGMGFESFKQMLPDLGKLYDLVLLLRDSEKNRKLFAPYMDTKGLHIHWGDLLNREDVAACIQGADIVLHIAAFVSPQADYYPKKAMPHATHEKFHSIHYQHVLRIQSSTTSLASHHYVDPTLLHLSLPN